jgi:hypothetical protein
VVVIVVDLTMRPLMRLGFDWWVVVIVVALTMRPLMRLGFDWWVVVRERLSSTMRAY